MPWHTQGRQACVSKKRGYKKLVIKQVNTEIVLFIQSFEKKSNLQDDLVLYILVNSDAGRWKILGLSFVKGGQNQPPKFGITAWWINWPRNLNLDTCEDSLDLSYRLFKFSDTISCHGSAMRWDKGSWDINRIPIRGRNWRSMSVRCKRRPKGFLLKTPLQMHWYERG